MYHAWAIAIVNSISAAVWVLYMRLTVQYYCTIQYLTINSCLVLDVSITSGNSLQRLIIFNFLVHQDICWIAFHIWMLVLIQSVCAKQQ